MGRTPVDRAQGVHDLVRLSHQQFVGRPDLAAAFYDGLGKMVGCAEAGLWRLENLNQALGTVVWANQVGDIAFEQAGRAMVERVVSDR